MFVDKLLWIPLKKIFQDIIYRYIRKVRGLEWINIVPCMLTTKKRQSTFVKLTSIMPSSVFDQWVTRSEPLVWFWQLQQVRRVPPGAPRYHPATQGDVWGEGGRRRWRLNVAVRLKHRGRRGLTARGRGATASSSHGPEEAKDIAVGGGGGAAVAPHPWDRSKGNGTDNLFALQWKKEQLKTPYCYIIISGHFWGHMTRVEN